MKRFQKIFTVIFFTLLVGMMVCNIVFKRQDILSDLQALALPQEAGELRQFTASVDAILADDLAGGYLWNEMYGITYAALGKKEENNFAYVKDKNDVMEFADFWGGQDYSPKEAVLRIRMLKEAVSSYGGKLLFLVYPSKFDLGEDDGYLGIPYRDYREQTDEFVRYLRYYGIDYIDYREYFEGQRKEDIFFKTDHHWKIQSAFRATGILVDYFKTHYGEELDPDSYYTDLDNYSIEEVAGYYMGSMGREAGKVYVGLEDFTYIIPKEQKHYYIGKTNTSYDSFTTTGSTYSALITQKYLGYDDAYVRELYNSYLGGVFLEDHIENRDTDSQKRIMFIRDSYSSPVIAFLAPMVRNIDAYWAINTEAEFLTGEIREKQPDYIILAFPGDQLSLDIVPFFEQEVTDLLYGEEE